MLLIELGRAQALCLIFKMQFYSVLRVALKYISYM